MSDWLHAHPLLHDQVAKDLRSCAGSPRHRSGLTIYSVSGLGFKSNTGRRTIGRWRSIRKTRCRSSSVSRLGPRHSPMKATLRAFISTIRGATWEACSHRLLEHNRARGVENAQVIRVDETATETAILGPAARVCCTIQYGSWFDGSNRHDPTAS